MNSSAFRRSRPSPRARLVHAMGALGRGAAVAAIGLGLGWMLGAGF